MSRTDMRSICLWVLCILASLVAGIGVSAFTYTSRPCDYCERGVIISEQGVREICPYCKGTRRLYD